MKITGHCLCGNISYEADTEVKSVSVCHCRDCQRQTGAANSLTVEVDDDALSVHGDTLSTFTTIGTVHQTNTNRSFCTNCGSPIVSRIDAFPGVAFIKAGTLDDTTWLKPTEELWCSSAQRWVTPLVGATRYDRDPE